MKSELVYKIECETCEKVGKKGIYIGESSRNGRSRSEEHIKDSLAATEKGILNSIILRHGMEQHDGDEIACKMTSLMNFQHDALARRVAINEVLDESLINTKMEYIQPGDIVASYNKTGRVKENERPKPPEEVMMKVLERNI